MLIRCINCFETHERGEEACPHCDYVAGDTALELNHLHPGMELGPKGRYSVGQVLGFGGFGTTYKVWDKNLHTVLAIKEYFPAGLVNRAPGTKEVTLYAANRRQEYDHGLMRFLDEARSMAKFSTHKNIINIFEYFEENNTAYIVMEYLDGLTLGEYLKTDEMDVDTCVEIILQVSAALKDIHAVGIVHRDVSPDNIFICTNGVIKLIDFDAARFSLDEDRQMTIILKPGFAPPEQYEKINVQGPWTDIYALGATLYYMITGTKPEESTNRRIEDTLIPPIEQNASIPAHINNTILKAMAIDRHMRFASVIEFEKGLNHQKKVLEPKKELKRRKTSRLIGVLAAVLVVAIGASIFTANYQRNKEAETLPDCQLVMWLPLPEGEADAASKKQAFEEIVKDFNASFDNVKIELKTFSQEEYQAAVMAAAQTKTLPNMFESTGLQANNLSGSLLLTDLVKGIDGKLCYFLNKYDNHFPVKNQLPLGFIAPVIYVNTTLAKPDEIDAAEASAMAGTDAQELFFNGEAKAYFASTSEFSAVQRAMPARYALVPVGAAQAQGKFSDLWSIGTCDNDQRKAAQRLLLFMLSDNAQDILHIRHRSGAVPINRQAAQVFSTVYSDFEGFFENIDEYTF